ncbi:MAG TPA: CBS domain-containing protein, partial [Gemmataceae bacterium]|nr:CBS domain-containing protein [Gemmataceae bacterium]
HVQSIGPDATVLDAAVLMNDHKIGSLVVTDGGRLVGIITERDLMVRIVALRRDPAATAVRDVMSGELLCGSIDTSVDEARGVMMKRRIRHLPIVDEDDRLLGLVSIGDLNAHLAHDQEVTIHVMREYIQGRV